MQSSNQLYIDIIYATARAIEKGNEILDTFSTDRFGFELPESILEASSVLSIRNELIQVAESLLAKANSLKAVNTSDPAALIIKVAEIADLIRLYISGLSRLKEELSNRISTDFSPGDDKVAALSFVEALPAKFLNYSLANYIEGFSKGLLLGLKAVGVAKWDELEPQFSNSVSTIVKELRLDWLKELIKNPADHLRNVIRWGAPDFDPRFFFAVFKQMYNPEAAIYIEEINGHPQISFGDFSLSRILVNGKTGLELIYKIALREGFYQRTKISENWGFGIETNFELEGEITMQVMPPLDVNILNPESVVSGTANFTLDRNPEARPWNFFTSEILTLSVENVGGGVGIQTELTSGSNLTFEPRLFAELSQAKLKIGSEDGDSFLAKIIAGAELEATFDLAMEFIPSKGLVVRAAGGVEIQIPIHKDLGPLRLDTFYLGLLIKNDGTLDLETSLGLGANLGPLKAVVERMGAKTLTNFIEGSDAEFGNIDTGLKFKPPNGVGLSLDAGIIKGGGYLFIDTDRGEYEGALELTFSEWIALKAIGLISTRMPDGSDGFSLLIVITVEFGAGIQLGFGFTLIGVGGILGLNRRTNIEPLSASIRTGAIESVMFPENVIENAPRIISDLRAFFPTEEGTFLIGPMVKIGWGTPTLISLSMGIIIEVPDPTITILGVLKVVLPDEEAAVLKLQVNFIGRIEFSNKLAWFYAELYDSRILFITLQGGLGVLVNWGDNSNFVVSVGGFHPDFNPPPLPFPEPPRIMVNLYNTPVAKVYILGYFAVTSNSVQFGARAEVFFGFSEFKIEGHFGFDALFIFSPFFFSFRLSIRLSVKVFGIGLFTVGFSGKLEGPTPWYIKGKGRIKLLFFKLNVPFEHTWGERKNTDLPPIEVLPLLEQELKMTSNWQANLPAGVHTLVSLRQLGDGESDELVLHPVGSLSISQRKVPLNVVLEKYGNQVPSDVEELTVGVTAGLDKLSDLQEQFAIGHFKDLKQEEKLSKPSFQPMNSGLSLSVSGDQTQTSAATARTMRYERILIDGAHRRRITEAIIAFFQLLIALLRLSRRNVVRQSAISATRQAEMKPQDQVVKLRPDQYTVVLRADNRPAGTLETVTFDNQVMAEDYLAREKRINPASAADLHVVPAVEANVRA